MARILVTGATGYIGGRLVARLLDAGHQVRCLVRDPERLAAHPWREQVEVVTGDVLTSSVDEPGGLADALRGCHAAYYLIHSMGASEHGFADRDRQAARNFAAAARTAKVGHLIYLGGLGEPSSISRHLASRQETGRLLAAGGVPTTEFRAAIIVGSGSISFEMIRYLTERLPVMITPRWVETRVQPIAIRDVLSYLVAALEHPPDGHRIVEIGGPEVLTYRLLMLGYAEVRGLRRTLLPVPVLSPRLSSYWVNLITPIPASLARPLIEGLSSEVVVRNPEPARRYGVTPIPYRRAVELALDRVSQGAVETLWSNALAAVPRGTPTADKLPPDRLLDTEGMLVDRRSVRVEADCDTLFGAVVRLGGEEGYYAFTWLWRLRGFLDRLLGGIGMRRGRRHPLELAPGDSVDFWRVESVAPGRHLQLRAEMKLPGRAWLRFDLQPLPAPPADGAATSEPDAPASATCELRQTAFFEPHGLVGYLYWWAVYPLHLLVFPAMLRALARRAEQQAAADPPAATQAPGRSKGR